MAVAYDNATTSHFGTGSGTSTTHSFSHTCAASASLAVYVDATKAAGLVGATVTCTYNSVSMTSILDASTTGNFIQTSSTTSGSCMFYLLAPASGANTVLITVSTACDYIIGGAISVTGAAAANNGVSTTSTGATNSPTLNVTSATNNMVIGGAAHGDTITGVGGTGTQRGIDNINNSYAGNNGVTATYPGTTTTATSYTSSVNDHWVVIGFQFTAAGAAATSILVRTRQGGSRRNHLLRR